MNNAGSEISCMNEDIELNIRSCTLERIWHKIYHTTVRFICTSIYAYTYIYSGCKKIFPWKLDYCREYHLASTLLAFRIIRYLGELCNFLL